MLKFKSSTIIEQTKGHEDTRLAEVARRSAILAHYDIEHSGNGKTLTSEMEVLLCEDTGKVLDAKVVIEGLKCDSIELLREKLGDWFSRLSAACTEPVVVKNFTPVYARDWPAISALQNAERDRIKALNPEIDTEGDD